MHGSNKKNRVGMPVQLGEHLGKVLILACLLVVNEEAATWVPAKPR